jgi:hypothetical protein
MEVCWEVFVMLNSVVGSIVGSNLSFESVVISVWLGTLPGNLMARDH